MRVVLVRLSALGDIVHTWPLAVKLSSLPEPTEITWIVERAMAPLVIDHPAVDSVVEVDTRAWRRRPLARSTRAAIHQFRDLLHSQHPDVCLDAQGVVKSALVSRWSGARRRIGFDRRWRRELVAGLAYTETVPLGPNPGHASHRFQRLASALGAVSDELLMPDGRWLLSESHQLPSENRAVLLPGAGRPEKVLPVRTLSMVAQALRSRGLDVLLAWGPGERERAAAVAAAADGAAEIAPPTTILELAQLMARSRIVIGADTGPVHLAASLQVATVAVHLTTNPERNGPLGSRCAVVSAVVPKPGRGRSSAARRVRDILPEEIVQAAEKLLVHSPR